MFRTGKKKLKNCFRVASLVKFILKLLSILFLILLIVRLNYDEGCFSCDNMCVPRIERQEISKQTFQIISSNQSKRRILIVSEARSGSTFLGSFLFSKLSVEYYYFLLDFRRSSTTNGFHLLQLRAINWSLIAICSVS